MWEETIAYALLDTYVPGWRLLREVHNQLDHIFLNALTPQVDLRLQLHHLTGSPPPELGPLLSMGISIPPLPPDLEIPLAGQLAKEIEKANSQWFEKELAELLAKDTLKEAGEVVERSLIRIAFDAAIRLLERFGIAIAADILAVIQGGLDPLMDVIAGVLDILMAKALLDMLAAIEQELKWPMFQWIDTLDGAINQPIDAIVTMDIPLISGVTSWFAGSDHTSSHPPPSIAYPPGIAGNPQKEALYTLLYLKYGDAFKVAYEAMSEDGYTSQQCEELITKFGLQTLETIATDTNKRDAIQYLWTVRNIPGIDKVVNSLATNTSNVNKIAGDLFELEWMSANAQNISQVQLPAIASNGKIVQGPDAQLKDGTIIQLKSYHWNGPPYNLSFYKDTGSLQKGFEQQVGATVRNYPGEPIRFVFNSRLGYPPSWVVDYLTETLANDYGITITVAIWP